MQSRWPVPYVTESSTIDPARLGWHGAKQKQLQILRFAQDDSPQAMQFSGAGSTDTLLDVLGE
jgi:hypothetical protein